jgi:hypothetical protein
MNHVSFLHDVDALSSTPLIRTMLERIRSRLGLPDPTDPCPDVNGMASPRKLRLLNRAVRELPNDNSECYFEVGTFQGKSIVGAALGNEQKTLVACDNFSLFDSPVAPENKNKLLANLDRYGLGSRVRFYDMDFLALVRQWSQEGLPPVGVYFYDGAHDEGSQYRGIHEVEPILADRAIVLVDDWRHAADSNSFAEAGTRRAIADSHHSWELERVLPARFNGDRVLWWNGLAIFSFSRKPRTL